MINKADCIVLRDAILTSFSWSNTEEGSVYWLGIAGRLSHKIFYDDEVIEFLLGSHEPIY
jgi:hypothetical protein